MAFKCSLQTHLLDPKFLFFWGHSSSIYDGVWVQCAESQNYFSSGDWFTLQILLLYKLFQSRWDLKISLFSKASYMFVGVRLRGGLWSSQPFPSLRPVMTGQPMGSLKGAGPSAPGWWTARYCLTGEVRQVRHLDRGVVIVVLWNGVLSHRLFKFFFTILSDIRYYCVEIIFTTSYYQHENCSYSYSANA